MIRFITGRSGSGKSETVTREVCDLINNTGREVVVIVPEQETVVWERKFAGLLKPSSNLRLEVTNFTNLARSVFREYGGLADSVIDDGSRILIMWRAMLSVWDSLKVYNNLSSREDRCIPILLRAVDELKSSGVTPEIAENALEMMSRQNDESVSNSDKNKQSKFGSFSDRLSDVTLVYAAYNSILHEDYIDKSDLETKLAKSIAENPYFKGKSVFVDSFLSYTSGQEKILREIMRTSADFTATVMTPVKAKNETEFDYSTETLEPQFAETHETLKKLITLANRLNLEYSVVPLCENLRHKLNSELALCERYIFDEPDISDDAILEKYGVIPSDSDEFFSDNIEIVQCKDKIDEARICSAAVNDLLKKGYNYSDIAVVAHDIDSYKGIVDVELRQHGFNCFISESSGVTQNPVIKFFTYVLKIISDGWRKEDIICLLKTGLISFNPVLNENEEAGELSNYAIVLFETYVNIWNLNGRAAYTGDDWSMNPDGFKIGITEYGERILRIVNSLKAQISESLGEFANVFDGENRAAPVVDIAKAIVHLAEVFNISAGLEKICESYKSYGMLEEAEKCGSGWRVLCEILDKMVDFLGDCYIDARKFSGLFYRVAQSMDTGSIPSGSNEILIGSAQGIRLENKKCIIILGANEGEFPGEANPDKQYFSERDRAELVNYGIELSCDNSETLSAREYCMFYRTISAASDKVIILYEEKKELSFAVSTICHLLERNVVSSSDFDVNFLVYDKRSCENYLLSKGCRDVKEVMNSLTINHSISDTSTDIPAVNSSDIKVSPTPHFESQKANILYLSQSKISTYLRCPFSYACKYEMKIKQRPTGEMSLPDIGIIIHAILQQYFSAIYSHSKDYNTADSREKLLHNIITSIKTELEKNVGTAEVRNEYLFIRIERQVRVFIEKLEEEITDSGFTPFLFEQKIGRTGIRPMEFVSSDGVRIIIEGVADRIDIRESESSVMIRVLDYKTGNKKFSMKDLENGTEIQLLIYVFSLLNACNLYEFNKPLSFGGAIYVSNNLSTVNVSREVDSEKVIDTAKDKIVFSGILPDSFSSDDKSNYVYLSESELSSSKDKLIADVKSIGDNILHNSFELAPRIIGGVDPCTWCNFAYICNFRSNNG